MMKNILKIIFAFILVYLFIPFSSAYNSSEIKTFYISWYTGWNSIFTVPEGKDLYVEKVYINDVWNTDYLELRNSTWSTMIHITSDLTILDDIDLIITDDLQINMLDSTDIYTIVWFLVSEDENMSYYINWNNSAWSQHIFDKDDIDFIYFREFIIFFFLVIFRFISIIINRPFNIF